MKFVVEGPLMNDEAIDSICNAAAWIDRAITAIVDDCEDMRNLGVENLSVIATLEAAALIIRTKLNNIR